MKNEGRNRAKFKKEITLQNYLTKSTINIKDVKRKSLNVDYKSNSYLSSIDINKKIKTNKPFQTKKILENFKIIIKQTEEIKNKILKAKKDNKDSSYLKKDNSNIIFSDNISNINKDEISENQYNIDDYVDYEESINNIKSIKGYYINKTKQKGNDEKKSLKLINNNLSNLNIKLINQNNYLEKEIDESKINLIKKLIENNPQNFDCNDSNFNNFINDLKISNHNNIYENLQLYKNIYEVLKKIQILYNNYKINDIKYKNLFIKLKKDDKIMKEIAKYKDNNKLHNLKDEQMKLNQELNKLNNILKDFKIKENTLSEKYETNLKSMQDYEEMISKLNNTIKYLNNEQLILSSNYGNKAMNKHKNISLNLYEVKINQLNLYIKSLKNQRHQLLTENFKLKEENKKLDENNNNNNNNVNDELQIKINELKKINIKNKSDIAEKDKQINFLKDIINKLSKALKENNLNDTIFKYNIDRLINDSNNFEYNILLKENELNENIKKVENINEMKTKQIVNITKVYEDIINKKDKEIFYLENKLNNKTGLLKTLKDKVMPLYKKNIVLRNNSFITNKKARIKYNINGNIKFSVHS